MPPKAKGRRRREAVKPISGLDVDALLGEKTKGQVSRENPIPDFKRALASTEEVGEIEDAAKQMGSIVRSLVTDSFGDSKYAQAVECMGVMREELTNLEEPGVYNSFVRDLKKASLSGALGGDRRDFWFAVRGSRLGLIDREQSEVSDVSSEQAEEVSSLTKHLDRPLTRKTVLHVEIDGLGLRCSSRLAKDTGKVAKACSPGKELTGIRASVAGPEALGAGDSGRAQGRWQRRPDVAGKKYSLQSRNLSRLGAFFPLPRPRPCGTVLADLAPQPSRCLCLPRRIMSDSALATQLALLQDVLGKKVGLRDPGELVEEAQEAEATDDKDEPSWEAWQAKDESPVTESNAWCRDPPAKRASTVRERPFARVSPDCSALRVGDMVGEDVAFCPWRALIAYPIMFIGKANKPRVRRANNTLGVPFSG